MIYAPRMEQYVIHIEHLIDQLSTVKGSGGEYLAQYDLIEIGSLAVHFLLRRLDNGKASPYHSLLIERTLKIMTTLIERDQLTMEQCRRYRLLITSDKCEEVNQ